MNQVPSPRRQTTIILAGWILFVGTFSLGCQAGLGNTPLATGEVPINALALSPQHITLQLWATPQQAYIPGIGSLQTDFPHPGGLSQLLPTFSPPEASGRALRWRSMNPSIVSVDENGVIRGVGIGGPVEIYAEPKVPLPGDSPGVFGVARVTVLGLELSTHKFMMQKNYTSQALEYRLNVPGAQVQSVAWTSDAPGIAPVTSGGVVSFSNPGRARILCRVTTTGGQVYERFCDVTVFTRDQVPMAVGQNLWNFGWTGPGDYIRPEFTQDNDADGLADLPPGENIWTSQFLTDLGTFHGTVRFMDWTGTNDIPVETWDQYPTSMAAALNQAPYTPMGWKDFPVREDLRKYFGGNDTLGIAVVPYRWIVDLCNRSGRDLWINVPTFAGDDYVRQLAIFLRDNLDPQLRIYLEYSNETWNGMFRANTYNKDKGSELGLPGFWGYTPGTTDSNIDYQGQSYTVYRSLQIFQIFQEEFPPGSLGRDKRVIRVLSAGGDAVLALEALRYIVFQGVTRNQVLTAIDNSSPLEGLEYNTLWNPQGQKPDLYSTAPYVGGYDPTGGWNEVSLNGMGPNIFQEWKNAVDWGVDHKIKNIMGEIAPYGIPYAAYEGGQHLGQGASHWGLNAGIYEGYKYMLDRWQSTGMTLFNHYTLYGGYAGHELGFDYWGSKTNSGAVGREAYKFQAIADWIQSRLP